MSTPTEVVDHIFSFLDVLSDSEYSDLKACAEAHPFLLKSAERYLFSDIRLTRRRNICRAFSPSQFSNVLRNKPHVANYVCALGLDLRSHSLDPYLVVQGDLEDMSFVMSKLSKLEKIEITGSKFSNSQWPMLSKPFREAFINCLGLPSIKKVSMIRIHNFPVITFGQCKGLVEFSLDEDFEFSGSGSTGPHPRLKSLSIYNWSRIFPDVISWANAHLRRLDVWVSTKDDLDRLSNLIRVCYRITDLELDFQHNYRINYTLSNRTFVSHNLVANLTLSPLTNLEHLTIHALLSVESFNAMMIATSLPAIVPLLETASSVKHLSFHFHYVFDSQKFVSDAHWYHLLPLSDLPAIEHTDFLVSARDQSRNLQPSEIMSLPGIMTLVNSGLAIRGEVHKCRHSRCCCML